MDKGVIQMETLHRHFSNSNLMASSKIKNNFLKAILAPWYREWLKQWKYLSFMEVKVFVFSVEGFNFLDFMKKMLNLTNTTLRGVWAWHLRSKIHEISGKMGFKFCKLIFFRDKWPSYIKIFLTTSAMEKPQ